MAIIQGKTSYIAITARTPYRQGSIESVESFVANVKGSTKRLFNEMDRFAKSLGPDVTYSWEDHRIKK